jgi:hypothetical protein
MPTKTLRIDGTHGVIAISNYNTSQAAITDPLSYLSDLYFHSGLDYSQIIAKSTAGSRYFTGVYRNYTSWNDDDKCCFITTACVKYNSETDDGETLTILRSFRDSYMIVNPELLKLVQHYYKIAPICVEKLESLPEAESIFKSLYTDYIVPAIINIKAKNNEAALTIYINGVKEAVRLAEKE